MKPLPNEVFLSIIKKLDLHGKLECIRVCKKWHLEIKDSILFESLVFDGDPKKLKAALNTFNKRQKSGQQVLSLEILSCIVDSSCTLLIPRVFPKLKNLTWIDTMEERYAPTNIMIQIFKLYKWTSLENITADALRLTTLQLLESAPSFPSLTSLTILFDTVPGTEKRCTLEKLIVSFTHLPALQHLVLSTAGISLQDMERIHKHAPQLKGLILDNVYLLVDDVDIVLNHGGALVKRNIASQLTYFNLSTANDKREFYEGTVTHANIVQWFMYFGMKYRNLITFHILTGVNLNALSNITTLEQHVAAVVSSMAHLDSYKMTLCPITLSILREMDCNDIVLKSMHLWITALNIKLQAEAFKTSKQRSHIKSLSLQHVDKSKFSAEDYGHMISLISQLKHLRKLQIDGHSLALQSMDFLTSVLQKMTSLEYLYINECTIYNVYIGITMNSSSNLRDSKKNYLNLKISSYRLANFDHVNSVFKYFLSVYQKQHFEAIEITGEILCGCGTIVLPFISHHTLKEISIDLLGYGRFLCTRKKDEEHSGIFELWRLPKGVLLSKQFMLDRPVEWGGEFRIKLKWEGGQRTEAYLYY